MTEPWDGYLASFHEERPGITEAVLASSTADGQDPYRWVAAAVPPGTVLDVACGNAPMAATRAGHDQWIGIDPSAGELAVAASLDRGPLARAALPWLPVAAGSVDAVVMTMALQIVPDPAAALAEYHRVLRPGGRVVLLVPTGAGLSARDLVFYGRLQVALRQRIEYPNDEVLAGDSLATLAAPYLGVVSDETRTFRFPVVDRDAADVFLRSLYLPSVTDDRLARARRVVAGRVGSRLSVPLRRVVLTRSTSGPVGE